MTYTVRRAERADLAPVLELETHFDGDRLSRRSLLHFLRTPSARVWVASTQEKVICAALVMLVRSQSTVARIYSLVVAPEFRGRGVASALIARAENDARRLGRVQVSLEVRQDNTPALRLYERLGYRVHRALPQYYDDGAAGLRLRKQLVSQCR